MYRQYFVLLQDSQIERPSCQNDMGERDFLSKT